MFRLTKNTDDFKKILQANDSKDVMNISLKDYVFNNSSKEGTIMFPTKYDITIDNYEDCKTVLKKLLIAGNDVLIVSKPTDMVIDRLTNDLKKWKDQILFRFIIGSMDNSILEFWEPNAPYFEDRKFALETAFNKGYRTSVSMEPLLDNDLYNTKVLIDTLEPYVTDFILIGKMNKPEKRINIKENDYIRDYLSRQNDDNILSIYNYFKDNEKIKWNESIKNFVGIDLPTKKGLDV